MLNQPPRQLPVANVVLLSPGLNLGGAERMELSLARFFQAAKVVGFVTRGGDHHPQLAIEAGQLAPVYITWSGELEDCRDNLREACKTADVIVSWGVRDLDLVTQDMQLPVVEVAHNSSEWPEMCQLLDDTVKGANYLVGVSRCAANAFPTEVRDQAAVIYNGIEIDRIVPRFGRAFCRERWDLAETDRVILSVARFATNKNHAAILAALQLLPSNWKLICAGCDSKEKEAFRSQAAALVPGRVRFASSTTQLGDLYAVADVFCLPSYYEGWPLALLEAMGAGLPCVAANWLALQELQAQCGEVAWAVPLRPTGQQVAGALQAAVAAGRGDLRVLRARQVIWEHFTAARMAARWEEYLLQLLPDWQRRASTPFMQIVEPTC